MLDVFVLQPIINAGDCFEVPHPFSLLDCIAAIVEPQSGSSNDNTTYINGRAIQVMTITGKLSGVLFNFLATGIVVFMITSNNNYELVVICKKAKAFIPEIVMSFTCISCDNEDICGFL